MRCARSQTGHKVARGGLDDLLLTFGAVVHVTIKEGFDFLDHLQERSEHSISQAALK